MEFAINIEQSIKINLRWCIEKVWQVDAMEKSKNHSKLGKKEFLHLTTK